MSALHAMVASELLTVWLSCTGKSLRHGVTDVPRVGKSTFMEAMCLDLIAQAVPMAVLFPVKKTLTSEF